MFDLVLTIALGFLGSFGHCVSMCGPITVAFSLSQTFPQSPGWRKAVYFHGLLNLGRIISYVVVGAVIGALGSVLIAGGQVAGIESGLRHILAIITGIMFIWMGLYQINPKLIPKLPQFHPLMQIKLHQYLNEKMLNLTKQFHWWTPIPLGLIWGMIPCGFLYIAQVKAAETTNFWMGGLTMLAFGIGTFPSMLGVGLSATLLSKDKRSQLYRLGGWVTLTIGMATLIRTGEMVDYTGYAALLCLILTLIARPCNRLIPKLLIYRRASGVGAYIFSLAHTAHMLDHHFEWNFDAISFMLPMQQIGIWTGFIALGLMTPAAMTSFDLMVEKLGKYWRLIHLVAVPALVFAVSHTILIGSTYLGSLEWTIGNKLLSALLGVITLAVLLLRINWVWTLLSLDKFYSDPNRIK